MWHLLATQVGEISLCRIEWIVCFQAQLLEQLHVEPHGESVSPFPADIPGVGFELDLQIPTPFVGPGISIGVDINNVWDLSFLVNLGLGIAIGGFSAGYTWGFPDTYNRSTIV